MRFQKGWASSTSHAKFVRALENKDCYGMRDAIITQNAQRKPVDPAAGLMKSQDRRFLDREGLADMDVGTVGFAQDMQKVRDLVEVRDAPLTELQGTLPLGFTELSVLFDGILVPGLERKDFITDVDTWQKISRAGDLPTESAAEVDSPRAITTGRDLANYVHNDNPFVQWGAAIDYLFANNVPLRTEESVDEVYSHCDAFACWGYPHIMGIVGEGIQRAGKISFTRKWAELVPRPEEASYVLDGIILPQVFPEGSPMHPSRNAMHSIAAMTGRYILESIFNKDHELPHGKTVSQELGLFADNIGYGRVWAGVHYPFDHECIRGAAKRLASKIVSEHL